MPLCRIKICNNAVRGFLLRNCKRGSNLYYISSRAKSLSSYTI